MSKGRNPVRLRLLIIGILAILVLVLLLVRGGGRELPEGTAGTPPFLSMDILIDSLLVRNGVDLSGVKKWWVKTPQGEIIRTERQVKVPSDLVTLEFNRDLNQGVARYGALVSATERSRESTVILHVVAGGRTVQTIHMETSRNVSGGETDNPLSRKR